MYQSRSGKVLARERRVEPGRGSMAYQSEAQLEKQLISQLSGQKFAPVAIADENALEANFKAQFEAFNKDKLDKPLSDKEWERVFNLLKGKSIF